MGPRRIRLSQIASSLPIVSILYPIIWGRFPSIKGVGTGSVSWERFCLLKSSLLPFESGTCPARTAAPRGCPKRPRELLGWYNGPEGNGARPRIPVTASAILWWLWHTSWSCFDRGPIVAAGPSRTLRHDGHGYPSRQWDELSQDVPAMDSDMWVALDLFSALVTLYVSP